MKVNLNTLQAICINDSGKYFLLLLRFINYSLQTCVIAIKLRINGTMGYGKTEFIILEKQYETYNIEDIASRIFGYLVWGAGVKVYNITLSNVPLKFSVEYYFIQDNFKYRGEMCKYISEMEFNVKLFPYFTVMMHPNELNLVGRLVDGYTVPSFDKGVTYQYVSRPSEDTIVLIDNYGKERALVDDEVILSVEEI